MGTVKLRRVDSLRPTKGRMEHLTIGEPSNGWISGGCYETLNRLRAGWDEHGAAILAWWKSEGLPGRPFAAWVFDDEYTAPEFHPDRVPAGYDVGGLPDPDPEYAEGRISHRVRYRPCLFPAIGAVVDVDSLHQFVEGPTSRHLLPGYRYLGTV